MNGTTNKYIIVFWSWQADSPAKYNRNFIHDCLDRAIKNVSKQTGAVIIIDRDTKGVGGMPGVTDVILEKIRRCDVFVWDASLVYKDPRPSPNSNVLIELGYALAIVGDRRLIGVFNTVSGDPADLPFDLKHRRWPIKYNYSEEDAQDEDKKNTIKSQLIKDFEHALAETLKEPKVGALHSDVDYHSAQRLWNIIDSKWMYNWYSWQRDHPQFETKANFDLLENYLYTARLPENKFINSNILSLHDSLLNALHGHLSKIILEMIPEGNGYIISIKRRGEIDEKEYDSEYDRQVEIVESGLEDIWKAWSNYVSELRLYYPEIIDA